MERKRRRGAPVLLAAAAAAALIACGRLEPSGNVSEGPGGPGAIEVVTDEQAFDPDSVTLAAGEEVTMEITNRDNEPHDFAIESLDLKTSIIGPGEVATATFTVPEGETEFVCTLHPGMAGTIRAR